MSAPTLRFPDGYPVPLAVRRRAERTEGGGRGRVLLLIGAAASVLAVVLLLVPMPGRTPRWDPIRGQVDYTGLGPADWVFVAVLVVGFALMLASLRRGGLGAGEHAEHAAAFQAFQQEQKDWVRETFRPWAAWAVGSDVDGREADQVLSSGSLTRRDGRGGEAVWDLVPEGDGFALRPRG